MNRKITIALLIVFNLWIWAGIVGATERGESRERQDRQERRESWSGMNLRDRQEPRERQEREVSHPVQSETPSGSSGGTTPFTPTDPSGNPVIYDDPIKGQDKG